MPEDIEVTPKPDAETSPEVTPQAPETPPTEGGDAKIPDEVLKIPAIQAILAGQPAAVSAPLKEFSARPEAKAIIKNAPTLQQAGFGLYRSLSGDLGVLFNQMHIHGEDLVNADKAGKLTEVAPPFDQVNDAVGKSGKDHPILKTQGVPNGFKSATPVQPPQASPEVTNPAPAPQSMGGPGPAQLQANRARLQNLAVGGPISGPRPGAGRILNNVLKPVV